MKRTLMLVAATLVGVMAWQGVADAHASSRLDHAGRAMYGWRITHHRHRSTTTAATIGYQPPGIQYTAFDDENCTADGIVGEMQDHRANVMRYIVPSNPAETYQGVACVTAARTAGYKVYLSIQYEADNTSPEIQALFKSVLQTYGPAWAIGIGNEEVLSPDLYEDGYEAAEPIIKAVDPTALVVGGEAFPWAITWSRDVLKAHLPGMNAWAEHCYDTKRGGLRMVPMMAAYAKAAGVPLFCSEMAPATLPDAQLPGFFRSTTLSRYNADLNSATKNSPNLEMDSYYVWPSIGAE